MSVNNPKISIVIPVLNEEKCITQLLTHLKNNCTPTNIEEIIIVDGGSRDATINLAETQNVVVLHSEKGRAKQLNYGAKNAKGSILYFLHIDTFPPENFDSEIITSVLNGNTVGCFRMKFDSSSWFLGFFAWFTKINHKLCRGGDQSLFISKSMFTKSGGFNENYLVFEDNEFIERLYHLAKFTVLPFYVKTSTRRYEERGEYNLQYHFGVIHLKNILGAGPEQLYDYYKRKVAGKGSSFRNLKAPLH